MDKLTRDEILDIFVNRTTTECSKFKLYDPDGPCIVVGKEALISLRAELGDVIAENEHLRSELIKIKAQRDDAISDLGFMPHCELCKFLNEDIDDPDSMCYSCYNQGNFKWYGL